MASPNDQNDRRQPAPPEDKNQSAGDGHLTLYIIAAIIAAIVLALALPGAAVLLSVGGEIFLRLLQMIVVPLVMTSVMAGILGMGDIRKLGRPGGYTVLYYLSTTVLAVATGLLVVNLINPGVGIDKKLVEDARREGEEAVDAAKSATARAPQRITWDFGSATSARESALSNPFSVPAENGAMLNVRVQQNGQANAPAQVQLQASREADEFHNVGPPLEFSGEPGVHKQSAPLPPEVRKIRLMFEPQQGGDSSIIVAEVERGPPGIGEIVENLVLMLFTNNLLGSMVEVNLLPIILFSIVFAGMLTTMGSRAETISNLVVGANDALMQFILLLMKLAPLGIFCLVAARFGKAQLEGQFLALLQVQFYYMATVLIGLAVHGLVTLPLLLYLFTGRNPYRFIVQMSQAVLTAFSTASSTATLPVTMECAETNAGVSKRSTEFVLPLGATINMDGTALYEAAAAIFIAQAYSALDPAFQITPLQQLTIAFTATLAAIGAAGIPEAGLVTMLIVLSAVGLPLELIGLILSVDWLLDRFRTAVNAFGDSVGAAIVDRWFVKV